MGMFDQDDRLSQHEIWETLTELGLALETLRQIRNAKDLETAQALAVETLKRISG